MHYLALIPLVKLVGYPGIFVIVFLESGVFFGFFLPGASMLFTAGLLSSQGFFSLWILVPSVALAAILGDSAGYWFGAKVGYRLFLWPDSRFFRHEYLEQAKEFYERHGVYAIVLARFVPIVRTFAPIIAGVVRMRYRTFLVYNVSGALLWGAGVTFLGYFLGERVPLVGHFLTPIVLLIVGLSLVPLVWNFLKRPEPPPPLA